MTHHTPKNPRPPVIPKHSDLTPRHAQSEVDNLIQSILIVDLDQIDGTTLIPDRATFENLASRDDVPGALGVREVKFVILGVDTDQPKLFFMNSKTHPLHYYFIRDVLGIGLSVAEFNPLTYFTKNRKFLVGTVLAHDSFTLPNGNPGLYAVEFWPTDPVDARYTILAFNLVYDAMPFAREELAFHPTGGAQEDLFAEQAEQYAAQNINTVSSHEIFSHIAYSPLNLGVGFGKLRIADGTSSRPPAITDIIIYPTLPNDLPHVAGVISVEPQTPLSHVNLRAKQNNTPNAYLRDATNEPYLVSLIGKIVRLEVQPDGIEIREATQAEMEQHLESARPKSGQTPVRSLRRRDILPLDALGHSNINSVGGKAANLAELRKILPPETVPNGFAVPFYFYDEFMKANDLYDDIRAEIAQPEFQNDNAIRSEALKAFRKRVKKAPIPTALNDQLGEMQNAFPAGTNPRCRSSANNEDMLGFTGAGLYDSYTQRPDEGHIEKSIKQVWASLWNYRAFEERIFYRVDHFAAAMGVLVHPNFDDELANGVALTKNIYFPTFEGYYINVQVGEDLVTNPEGTAIAEEILVMKDINLNAASVFETIRIRRSNLIPADQVVLNAEHLDELTWHMKLIQEHFGRIYSRQDDPTFAMDIEFKIDRDNQLIIKQARPWVD